MSKKPLDILKDVWGHQQFRPAQESIIDSVLSGKDTLALLPTGGGKSICFQVPALCLEGICLVVSPLIALMKDQVENLRQKGIKAAAIYSGMSLDEIDLVIDNCLYGDYKFLYLSPERLLSEKMMTRIARMKVSLIAIDEAHCISQWGYDFRPPYLEIFKIRESHPKAPILALTATATPEVQSDIMKRLEFKTENLFKVSFTRKNLSYRVYKPDDKIVEAVSMIKQLKGSAIVYVRNRKKTKEISDILQSEGITSTFYHAGLPAVLRTQHYLQIPIGGGMGNSYDFDIASFIDRYQLHPLKTSSAIRVLENEGFISLSENIFIPSKIHFTVSPTELYRFQVSNHAYDRLIKLILRSCEGVFEDYVRINESELADRTGIPYKELTRMLEYLEKISMMRYVPRKDAPQLTFCIPREDSDYLGIDLKSYRLRKERFIKRAESMAHYTTTLTRCRSNMLVSYFGETPIYHCGICDYCKRSSASKDRIETHQSTISKILVSLESGPATIISISNNLQDLTPEQIQDLIRNMMESGLVQIDSTGMVHKL